MRLRFFAALALGSAAALSAQTATTPAPKPPPLAMSIAGHPDWPKARSAADVDSVDHIVAALYDVISGPPGKRDWARFRSLFLPDAHLGVAIADTPAKDGKPAKQSDAVVITPDMYVERDDPYFSAHGFFEHSLANRVEEFGSLAQVWSTYESRNNADDAKPFERGINSIQLFHAQGRWWIVSVMWDQERDGLTLPEKYTH